MSETSPFALICHLGGDDRLSAALRQQVAAVAGSPAASVAELRDLAVLALDSRAAWSEAFSAGSLVIGCRRPRAVRALLAQAGVVLDQAAVTWIADPEPADGLPPTTTGAWYPVIDRERCKDCGQCRQFCLFGVYTQDAAGHVRVEKPLHCKPGCPACARICPAAAIVFPFCPDSPINGDAVPDDRKVAADSAAWRERLAANPMRALAARQARGATAGVDPARLARALAERAAARPPAAQEGL